jgi:hypothetical protein
VEWYDDHSNKALVYKNQFVFAYTGLAKIPIRKTGQDTLSTIDWAAEHLSKGKNLDEAIYNLKYRATELMNSNSIRKLPEHNRRIAFIGAGFDEVESGSKRIRRPLRIMIENFIEDDGTLLDQPRNEFRVQRALLKNCDAALYIAGYQPLPEKRIAFARLLRRFVQHNAKPEKIGVLLTSKIQEVSKAMSNDRKSVGENIMCTFVPRAYNVKNDESMRVPITGGILLELPLNSTETPILKPAKFPSLEERIVILPSLDAPNDQGFDSPRFAYIAEDNRALPYHNPVFVKPGRVLPPISVTGISVTTPPFVRTSEPQTNVPV